MSTSEIGMPRTFAVRARGCVLSEQVSETETSQAEEKLRSAIEAETQQRMTNRLNAIERRQQQRWSTLEDQLENTLRSMERDIKRQLIELSIRIAEIILRRELPDVDMLRTVLEDILKPISDFQGVRVRMAPGDAELLRGTSDQTAHGAYLEWVEAPDLNPGDIQVESRNGFFDGRLRERLATLAEALGNSHETSGRQP